jgi:large subunit ribosomal protein L13
MSQYVGKVHTTIPGNEDMKRVRELRKI